jgi:hypothetical protein
MRVLIGIVHDTDDRNPVAADLARDVTVEIFRSHDGNLIFGGAARHGLHKQGKKQGERGHGFFHEKIMRLWQA